MAPTFSYLGRCGPLTERELGPCGDHSLAGCSVGLNPLAVRHRTIWQYAQNRPSLICEDLAALGVEPRHAMQVLLARGVCKWLAARRDFIRLKDTLGAELTGLYLAAGKLPRGSCARAKLAGRIGALEEVRASIRRICHSPRWRVPDHDPRGAALAKECQGG